MPTLIALDISMSMQRVIPGRSEENSLTYLQLAIKGVCHLLDFLTTQSKLEYVALLFYSSTVEVKVDFTRDYDQIRQTVKKAETIDKLCPVTMLKTIPSIFSTNWGSHSHCQVVALTNCSVDVGKESIATIVAKYELDENKDSYLWIEELRNFKISFICTGAQSDFNFKQSVCIYQNFCEMFALNNVKFYVHKTTKETDDNINERKSLLGRTAMIEMVERFCEDNCKPHEAILKCGGYFRLECPIIIWPPPLPYKNNAVEREIAKKLEVCGFLALSDVGSPASLSRHLILPKVEREKCNNRRSTEKTNTNVKKSNTLFAYEPNYEYKKLEQDIHDFYGCELRETEESGEDTEHNKSNNSSEMQKESLCILLHAALKLESSAALVLLGDNWYGFVYPYADSKKKSNLMLNILPPGNNVIPWLGDLKLLGFVEDLLPGEVSVFPVKAEKRSYAQSCVVWIRHVSLQSDVQKVLRHAKKMPEKTQHFFKELNRIRRAALSIGFVDLLDAMAGLLEKESSSLAANANPECSMQLMHAANELRKPTNRDLKISISPLQKFTANDGTLQAVTGMSAAKSTDETANAVAVTMFK